MTESEFSFSFINKFNFDVQLLLDEVTDQESYKKDKSCTVCNSPFSLIGSSKKFHCKFCYRGICRRCSMHTMYHPQLKKKSRFCDNCYKHSVEIGVLKNFSGELVKEQSELQVFEEVLFSETQINQAELRHKNNLENEFTHIKNENQTKELELFKRIDSAKGDYKSLDEESKALAMRIEDLKSKNKRKENEITQKRQNIEDISLEFENDESKLNELSRLTLLQQEENSKLRQAPLEEATLPESSSVQLQLAAVNSELKGLKHRNDLLRKKMNHLRDKKDQKDSDISLLTIHLNQPLVSEPDSDYEATSQTLLQTLATQNREILELKEKISSSDPNDSEPLSSSRCRCTIQ